MTLKLHIIKYYIQLASTDIIKDSESCKCVMFYNFECCVIFFEIRKKLFPAH